MSLEAYERVRTDAIRFVIKRGNEVASLERVVQETADYAAVEKLEGEPASIGCGDEASPA
jgi:hypothetical protein